MIQTWKELFDQEAGKRYWRSLMEAVDEEYEEHTVYPPRDRIFHAFDATALKTVKVVILGQDPYHGEGMATGMSFSVNHGVDIPRSLQNIYKELQTDVGFHPPSHGCLDEWATQGVFLLNSTLTVRAHEANSHAHLGWGLFTDEVVRVLNQRSKIGRAHV